MDSDSKSERKAAGRRKKSVNTVASKQKNIEMTSLNTNDKRLLHELLVHKFELQMQNDELNRMKDELLVSHDRYAALYDLAPVSYFTLTEKGVILEANFATATLLGVPRSALLNQPISRFIATDDLKSFVSHIKKLLETSFVRLGPCIVL
ncbi:MAG: PAS domain-containing protein [Desulfuromonadales bacterium]|nr:PAS domain-containing protein [Desulfuromonadales bacterium]